MWRQQYINYQEMKYMLGFCGGAYLKFREQLKGGALALVRGGRILKFE